MFDRASGLALYFVLIASASASVLSIGDRFARHVALLATERKETVHISRVMIGLEAQERAKFWQPVSYTSIVPDKAPRISLAELAHNLDEAESSKPPLAPAHPSTHIILVRPHRAIHITKRPARTRHQLAHRRFRSGKRPSKNLTTAQIILRGLTSDL